MKIIKSGKGQLSLEAAIVILFLLITISALFLGGPLQQAAEKSTDTNGVLLAAHAMDAIASAVETVGMGGMGQRVDITIHEPFNSVDAEYEEGLYRDEYGNWKDGPHIRMSILMYGNLSEYGEGFHKYYVGPTGRAWWEDPAEPGAREWPYETPFYYKNITKAVKFEHDPDFIKSKDFQLCVDEFMKDSTVMRGEGTRFKYLYTGDPANVQLRPIKFCCEAGFNLHLTLLKPLDPENNRFVLRSRYYFSLPDDWVMKV